MAMAIDLVNVKLHRTGVNSCRLVVMCARG